MSQPKPKLELVSLRKEYEGGDVPAVDDIDLRIEAGETVALLGPSGCGKSTTLNMVVGLEEPTAGDIQVDGKSIVGIPAGQRNVGMVFQDYAVFTSMTVRQNLAFGLEIKRRSKHEVARAVGEVAELLGMEDKLNARARDLGGSELQRVAIGRTLVTKPAILLLDEPLSNLEYAARLAMRRELRRLQSEIGLTIIYVTHDQVEALSLADRIAVMRAGKILQVEKTSVICEQPEHTFVASFLGSPPMNIYRGDVESTHDGVAFRHARFTLPLPPPPEGIDPPGHLALGIRPEAVTVTSPERGTVHGVVQLVETRGPEVVFSVLVESDIIKVVAPAHAHPQEGDTIGLVIEREALAYFHNDSSCRIENYWDGVRS